MDKRNKFFSVAAAMLALKGIAFKFEGTYLDCRNFSITLDVHDKNKVWIEHDNKDVSFTQLDTFKKFIKLIIQR